MRTGDCQFGNSCRYHYPLKAASQREFLSARLTLCPGIASCSHYEVLFSSLSYIMSAYTDMPFAPYPLGSSLLGTPALLSSSSSNDQRTEFHSSSSF
ncbi:hypothetical protein Bca4012_027752 [Brassica carinata]